MSDPFGLPLPTAPAAPPARPGPSWAAATWTVPVVPGVVFAIVVRLGIGSSEGRARIVALTVLVVLAVGGLLALLGARHRLVRGVGLGVLTGAAATAAVVLASR